MTPTPHGVAGHGRHRGAAVIGHYRRPIRRAGQLLAASLSALLFAAFGYGFYNYNNLTSHQHTSAVRGLGGGSAGGSGAAGSHHDGSAQNILIVGLDSRAGLTDAQKRHYKVGLDDESTSTDTIIVVHVPADGSRATLLSIPRDTYVEIPGYKSAKINSAYVDAYQYGNGTNAAEDAANGQSKLVKVVKILTGLRIDHYVQVGFSGFVDIVRAIHSVPVDLCDPVDDTYAHNRAENQTGGSGFKMGAGHHDLTPQQALEFVRQRHNIPGPVPNDLGREARQRYFLKQAFHRIASANVLLNPIKLRDLINAVDGAFTFDQRGFGILQFAEQMAQLTAGNIKGQSIPTTGMHTYPYPVGTAVTVDVAAVHRFAHNLFAGTSAKGQHSGGSRHHPRNTDPAPSGCIY